MFAAKSLLAEYIVCVIKSSSLFTIFSFIVFRDQVTQTKKDNYSNVPKPEVFLAGLRGGGMSQPTKLTKMDLTIDVDQT